MMHHTLKYGACLQEFSRVLDLAMKKHDEIMLVPGIISSLNEHIEKLLGPVSYTHLTLPTKRIV